MSISSRFLLVKLLRLGDRRLLMALLLLTSSLLPSIPVYADSAPGTTIENQSTGSFVDELNSQSYNINSNLVSIKVAEVAGITITPQTAPSNVLTGSVVNFDFSIANIGNDPTQFFVPDAPSTITGGTAGTLQIISYDPDGSGPLAPVDLTANNITVPAGGANTSTLLGALATANNGSIPAGGSIVVRVPVTVTALTNQPVNVTLGNTDGRSLTQNQVYQAGTKDLYTVDNADNIPGEAAGVPINGDTTGHRQEASAIQTITVIGIDYGDAPDTSATTGTGNYQTTLAHGGPSHIIVPGLALGTNIDADPGTLQNANADADNSTGTPNDEDGVGSLPTLNVAAGQAYVVPVSVTNTTGQPAYLVGYIDFNKDGDFDDPGEKSAIITVSANPTGTQAVTFTTPSGITPGTTYARFRLSSTQSEIESAVGAAASGEVEDYKISISAAPLVCNNSASDGSYATSGLNKNSIWWLNFECYDEIIASTGAGQPFSFTLPDGSTMTLAVNKTGPKPVRTTTTTPATSPFSTFGTSTQYAGVTGKPAFYNATNPGSGIQDWTETLTNIVVKDKAGNTRNYTFVSADAENSNAVGDPFGNTGLEQLKFGTNGTNWSLIELLSTTASPPTNTLTGIGSSNATWTANGNNNGSLIISTNNPTQVALSAAMGGAASNFYTSAQGGLFGIGMPKITLIKKIDGRVATTDQFTTEIDYTAPTVALQTVTSTGTATTTTTGAVSVLPGNVINLKETMAAGSSSALTQYSSSIACTNANPTGTVLPSGAGTSFNLTTKIGDDITCTITNKTKANLLLVKRVTAINGNSTKNPNDNTPLNLFIDDTSATTTAPNDNHCNWPGATGSTGACTNTYTLGALAPGKVKPGDEVEYTIYYLNAGNNKATARVCDRLNPNLSFQPNFDASNVAKGIGFNPGGTGITYLTNLGSDADKGQLTNASVTNCNLPTNAGTEVVAVDVGDTTTPVMGSTGAGAPTGSYGYIRFKAVVK